MFLSKAEEIEWASPNLEEGGFYEPGWNGPDSEEGEIYEPEWNSPKLKEGGDYEAGFEKYMKEMEHSGIKRRGSKVMCSKNF